MWTLNYSWFGRLSTLGREHWCFDYVLWFSCLFHVLQVYLSLICYLDQQNCLIYCIITPVIPLSWLPCFLLPYILFYHSGVPIYTKKHILTFPFLLYKSNPKRWTLRIQNWWTIPLTNNDQRNPGREWVPLWTQLTRENTQKHW